MSNKDVLLAATAEIIIAIVGVDLNHEDFKFGPVSSMGKNTQSLNFKKAFY